MELKMEVYSPALELIGLLSVFRSVMWEENAFTAGTFAVDSIISEESRALLVPENVIWIAEDAAGIIEHIEASVGDEGPYITAKGRLLAGILERRILWGRYAMYGEPPAIMYALVEDCAINPTRGTRPAARIIPGLSLDGSPPPMLGVYTAIVGSAIIGTATIGATGGDTEIRKQKTGGSLLEALEDIGASNQVAFGVRFDAAAAKMLFWARPGVDRTVGQGVNEPVFFSTELDDVLSSAYSYDSSGYSNFSLVAGEGDGDQRVYVTADRDGGGDASGLSLRESFVDARDLQSQAVGEDEAMTAEEYAEVLTNRGREKLAEARLVRSFDAVVRTYGAAYTYGVDFFAGDTITVTDSRLGISVDAVVQGASRAMSSQGETLTLTLGYGQPTVYDILRRKAGK